MNLKTTILIHIFILGAYACAMGGKPLRETVKRKDQDKLWRPCQDNEVRGAKPYGWLCSKRCANRGSKDKCKEWKFRRRNFSNPKDFLFFRGSSFVFIDEDNL